MAKKNKVKRKLEDSYGFTTRPEMEQVNVTRSISLCNLFHFLFAASKACLMPFLTLFFRMMGFSATNTGAIMMVKTLVAFIWAPLWARCAIACNRRRCMLLFSLFFMSLTYLSLSVLYTELYHSSACHMVNSGNGGTSNQSKSTSAQVLPGQGVGSPENFMTTVSTLSVNSTEKPLHQNETESGNGIHSLTGLKNSTVSTATSTAIVTNSTPAMTTLTPEQTVADDSSGVPSHEQQIRKLVEQGRKLLRDNHLSVSAIQAYGFSDDRLYALVSRNFPPGVHISKEQFKEIWHRLVTEEGNAKNGQHEHARSMERAQREVSAGMDEHSIAQRDIIVHTGNHSDFSLSLTTLREFVDSVKGTLQTQNLQKFLVVLFIILVGELFASPVEKIADDAWYDFLEHIDDLEKYGKQRVWGSVAFTLVPVVVSVGVDYSPCSLPFNLHHFMLHFYLFGGLMALTFLTAFFYPVPAPTKRKYTSKVAKGMQAVCCDGRGFLYAATLLVMGVSYASYSNFLFWCLDDLGARHTLYGLCVMVAAFSEIPMLMLSSKLVTWLGNAGVAALAMGCLAARTLFYSFLWTPWVVLPAELLHAFTHTAMWYAVLSYSEFNVGHAVDRSIRSVLSSIYFGVGFSTGSIASGLVFDHFGSAILFQSVCVLVAAWCIIFGIAQRCLPQKEQIKYSKLLNGGVQDSDESNDDDDGDDWLEMALNEH